MNRKIAIQGYQGSFHDEACNIHFGGTVESIPADSFEQLSRMLLDNDVDAAVMAIENSIAGTILQNYRILRECGFWISGEKYLRIKHNLCALPGVKLKDLKEVHSHPMAINQCLDYLRKYPHLKLVETEDTALSAKIISEGSLSEVASISSMKASEIYDLNILAEGIETNKMNYTRFFIVEKEAAKVHEDDVDKSSIYIRIPDQKGQLLKVLQTIDNHNLNMSKLQSFPVVGRPREYFFHLDIEFDHLDSYLGLRKDLLPITQEYTELGIYRRDYMNKAVMS